MEYGKKPIFSHDTGYLTTYSNIYYLLKNN